MSPRPARRLSLRILTVVGVLLVVAVALVVLLPSAALSMLRGPIEKQLGAALERPVRIEGAFDIALGLSPTLEIGRLRVVNEPGWHDPDLLLVDSVRAGVELIPILTGRGLHVTQLSVDRLHVYLESRADGTRSWSGGRAPAAAGPAPDAEGRAVTAREGGDGGTAPSLTDVSLDTLQIRDVRIIHRNAVAGRTDEITLDEVTGTAPRGQAMKLDIAGTLGAAGFTATLTGDPIEVLLDPARPWPAQASGRMAGAVLEAKGEVGNGEATLDLRLAGERLTDLEALLQARPPPLGSYVFELSLGADLGRIRVPRLRARIGDTEVDGKVDVDLDQTPPRIVGSIDVPGIDIGPLLAMVDSAATPGSGSPPAAAEALPAAAGGDTAHAADLDEPIFTLDLLRAFDARLDLTVGQVTGGSLVPRDARLAVELEDGALRAPMSVTAADVLFEGVLEAGIVDGVPAARFALDARARSVGSLVEAVTGLPGVEGRVSSVRVESELKGQSMRALLSGTSLEMHVEDGSLSYGNYRGGTPVEFTLSEARLSMPEGSPAVLTANGRLLGERFALRLETGSLERVLVAREWATRLELSGDGVTLRAKGEVDGPEGSREATLDVALEAPRFGVLSRWLGTDPRSDAPLKTGGRLRLSPGRIGFEDLTLELGRTSLEGELVRDGSGERPQNRLRLAARRIDLAELASVLAPGEAEAVATPAPGAAAGVPGAASGGDARLELPVLPEGIVIGDSRLDIEAEQVTTRRLEFRRLRLDAVNQRGEVPHANFQAQAGWAALRGRVDASFDGDEPTFEVQARIRDLDLGMLLGRLEVLQGLDAHLGEATLEATLRGADTLRALRQSRVTVALSGGRWSLTAPGQQRSVDVVLSEGTLRAGDGKPLTVTLEGELEDVPVSISLTGNALEELAAPGEDLVLRLEAAILGNRVVLQERAKRPLDLSTAGFDFELTSGRLDSLDALLDASLPPWGPSRLAGRLSATERALRLDRVRLEVGDSRLEGDARLDTAVSPPRLEARLVTPVLQVDDFRVGEWSAFEVDREEGTAAAPVPADTTARAGDGEVHALLSPEGLRQLDAAIAVEVAEVRSGSDVLGRGRLELSLDDGRLAIDPLLVGLPGGEATMVATLEPAAPGLAASLDLKVDQLDYGVLARRIDPASKVGGRLNLDVELAGRAASPDEFLKSTNGHLAFGVWPNDLAAGIFDLWAVNLMTAVTDAMTESRVNCIVAGFGMSDGVLRPNAILVDSNRIQASGDGAIDFNRESVDFVFTPRPKRAEFLSAATPVEVRGSFDDFGVGPSTAAIAATIVRMATSIITVPIQRVFTTPVAPDGAQACAEAWSVSTTSPPPAPTPGAQPSPEE